MDALFDKVVNRFNSNSAKWDGTAMNYGEDVIPLSVADMDISAPKLLIDEATKIAEHGIFGYTELFPPYYATVQHWLEQHYHWKVPTDWIVFSPRIVQAVSLIIQDFTAPGDAILIHGPAYQPIANAVVLNGRKLVESPLLLKNYHYEIDFDDMERHMQEGAKVLLLCTPHNPTGRVWTREELEKMAKLCVKYDVLIVSDDIHADFIRPGHEHTVIARLGEDIAQRSIICTSPGKTFNLASIEIANIIIPNDKLREKFQNSLQKSGIHNPTYFAPPLLEIAYTRCNDWLEGLNKYIECNYQYVTAFFKNHFPELNIIEPEGTYLLWIDCRAFSTDERKLKEWLIEKSKVSVSFGSSFGVLGTGFIRLNLAAPKATLEKALQRMKSTYTF